MAHDRYTGKEVKLVAGPITGNLKSIEFEVKKEIWNAPSSDARTPKRGTKMVDASIKITGWDSDATDGTAFGELVTLLLKNYQLDELDFTDDAVTPASKLPDDFWDDFPLEEWGIESVTGKDYSQDPADWSITLTPCHADLVAAP